MSSDRSDAPRDGAGDAPGRKRESPRIAPATLLEMLAARCGARSSGRTALLVVALNRSDRLAALAQDASNQYVLAEVARRVQSMLGPADRYAFVANDELWLMLGNLADESLAELAGRTLHDTLQRPIRAQRADGSPAVVQLRPVIGGAWTTMRTLADPMSMVAAASQACARARTQENQLLISRLDDDAALIRRDELERDLRAALHANQLDVHFQPQIDLASGRCVALESLIRWNRADGSAVNPALIASVCEERGMMGALTQFVLNNALRNQKRWAGQGLDLSVSVNLSPTVLSDAAFPMLVSHALATWGVPGERLTLEFTESAIAQNEQPAIEFMGQLRALGCRLSLDDFGTGYSSIAWFGKLPLDELKIDRSFVRDLGITPQSSAVVTAIIALARSLGLRVIGEGVESLRQMEVLHRLGCGVMQGYLFSRPIPPGDIERWLEQTVLPRKATWIASATEDAPRVVGGRA